MLETHLGYEIPKSIEPFNLSRIIQPNTQVLLIGENHQLDYHDIFTANLLPELRIFGFDTLALEGVGPETNDTLASLQPNQTLDFTNEYYGSSVGSIQPRAYLLAEAINQGLNLYGVDMNQQQLAESIPDIMEIIIPNPEDRSLAADILQGNIPDINQLIASNSSVDQAGKILIDADTWNQIQALEAQVMRISKILLQGGQNLTNFIEQKIMIERDQPMSHNIAQLINSGRRPLLYVGATHLRNTPDSTSGLLKNMNPATILLASEGDFYGYNSYIKNLEQIYQHENQTTMMNIGNNTWIVNIK